MNGLGSGRQRKAEIQEKNQIRRLIKAYFLVSSTFSIRIVDSLPSRDLQIENKICKISNQTQNSLDLYS